MQLRLYTVDGAVDPAAMREFACTVAAAPAGPASPREPGDCAVAAPHALDRRLVQLVVKAAYALRATTIVAVSGYRAPGRGKAGRHGTGEALDFRLEGIPAATLAAYLRTFPRVGVGIYTHPRTQYVHLDVRDESFHWIDASPPGITWRERALTDSRRVVRDSQYTPASDLPLTASSLSPLLSPPRR